MILVTGGLGYIGSHTCVALQHAGYALIVVDNLANSKITVLERIRSLGGGSVEFHQTDVRDAGALSAVFDRYPVEAVTGVTIPREFAPWRPGGAVSSYADTSLALRELGWQSHLGIDDMCRDSWAWQNSNPQGYLD